MRAITVILGLLLSLGSVSAQSTNNIRALSLQESVRMALEKNLGLQGARIDVGIAGAQVFSSYGYYDPVWSTDARYFSTTDEGRIDTATGLPGPPGERTVHSLSSGLVGVLPWGMRYDVGADLNYLTQEERVNVTNTLRGVQYSADTGVLITQPLLRNFWIDPSRTTIKINKSNLRVSELALLQTVHQLVRSVHFNYYELIFARDNVRVQEKALELADRLATENAKKVEVGTLAPLDEKQAQSAAATARADLIVARRQLEAQENVLIRLITDNFESWQGVSVVPTENLIAVPQSYSLPASWVSALTFRPDFNQAKELIEQGELNVRLRQNQLFPQLDAVGTYGRAGVDRGFSAALADIQDERLPRYSFGVVLSVPLENRTARGQYREAKLRRDRSKLNFTSLREGVLVEVEDAVARAQSGFQQVAATREARETSEAALDAEQKKFENGKSTSFNVLQFQKDLSDARSAEIRALADYNQALSDLYFSEGTILEKSRISVESK